MTKDDIINAAFQVWEADFYKKMSLSSLAEYLGVTKAALYRHFKNKEELLEAMTSSFFDSYLGFIQPWFEASMKAKNDVDGLLIITRGITEYYARNKSGFIFSLVELSDHKSSPAKDMGTQMKARGIELQKLPFFKSREKSMMTIQLSSKVAIFMTAVFFLDRKGKSREPTQQEITKLLDRVEYQISYGLGFTKEDADSIDFRKLERMITVKVPEEQKKDNILKAVGNAIAQAGPRDASMELVAKHAGLSKSGLYSHFKSKEDMLRQFFSGEFEKICSTVAVMPETEKPGEQLYFIIGFIIKYLQARPEIMIALDWLRMQRIDLGMAIPGGIVTWLSNPGFVKTVPGEKGKEMSQEELHQYIIFCIMGLLKRCYSSSSSGNIELSNENIRFFYRFLISGVKGGII